MSAHSSIAEFITKLSIPKTVHSWLKSVYEMHSVEANTEIAVYQLLNTVDTI